MRLKFQLTLLLLALVAPGAFTAQAAQAAQAADAPGARANGDQTLVAKALRDPALRACLKDARAPHYEINATVTTVSICIVSGFIQRVDFTKDPRCRGNQVCPKLPSLLVGSAEFGCEGELLGTTCYQPAE